MDVYPLIFEPIFKPKIWGGRKLEELLCKRLPAGHKIGESWEVADLEDEWLRVWAVVRPRLHAPLVVCCLLEDRAGASEVDDAAGAFELIDEVVVVDLLALGALLADVV